MEESKETSDKKVRKQSVLQFKVSTVSNMHKLSSAIYKTFLEGTDFEIIAIGAGACNQAVKSLAEARGKLSKSGFEVLFSVFFRDIAVDKKPNKSDDKSDGVISALVFRIVEVGDERVTE